MTSGFVNRWKGKVKADAVFVGRGGLTNLVQTINIAGGASTTLWNSGVSIVSDSSAAQIVLLDPPTPGLFKTIYVTTMSSGAIAIKASATGAVTFDGLNYVWKPSTQNSTGAATNLPSSLDLIGASTSQWINLGVAPSVSTTGVTIGHGLTTSS